MSQPDEEVNHLKTKRNLVWTAKRPFLDKPRESPDFTFKNVVWSLTLEYERPPPNSGYSSCGYYLYVTNKTRKNHYSGEIFDAKVYFEDECQILKWRYTITGNLVTKDRPRCLGRVTPVLDKTGNFTLHCISAKNHEFECCEKDPSLPVKRKKTSYEHFLDQALSYSLDRLSNDLSSLLDKKLLPDVQLRVGDQTTPAHKAILAARSEVFADKFQHGVAESKSGVIDIYDVEPSLFEAFLKYIYTGNISEHLEEDDTVSKLYALSGKYAVSPLKSICSRIMERRISEESYQSYLTLACSYNDETLKNAVISFVMKNMILLKGNSWITFANMKPHLALEIYNKCVDRIVN